MCFHDGAEGEVMVWNPVTRKKTKEGVTRVTRVGERQDYCRTDTDFGSSVVVRTGESKGKARTRRSTDVL